MRHRVADVRSLASSSRSADRRSAQRLDERAVGLLDLAFAAVDRDGIRPIDEQAFERRVPVSKHRVTPLRGHDGPHVVVPGILGLGPAPLVKSRRVYLVWWGWHANSTELPTVGHGAPPATSPGPVRAAEDDEAAESDACAR